MSNESKKKHSKRLTKIIMLLLLCTIVLSVSTYAWFIGMKTVDVDKFDIKIATTEGLMLSMDGVKWSYDLDAKNATAYAGNANQWLTEDGQGLIPMSTVGDMDATASRMKLFEKGSLTSTPGGARLLTSRVDNYTKKVQVDGADGIEFIEGDGYVAFDLFIRNTSGRAYYEENEPLNEEAIYLTTNSAVTVSDTGGKANTGIENSVRVGFVQLGRVENYEPADAADAKKITDITCSDDTTNKVTGICRNAQIWEPNDRAHVQNAMNYYTTNCLNRKAEGTDVNSKDSYEETACAALTKTGDVYDYYPTYAISNEIKLTDTDFGVNIYDGEKYNGYTKSTMSYADYNDATKTPDKTKAQLVSFPYFTDTDKMIKGTQRPQFMSLAPNSITKVRVYIWIEGQDIDNYDFASLGKEISVNFGFTKEQLVSEKDSPKPEYDYDNQGGELNIETRPSETETPDTPGV